MSGWTPWRGTRIPAPPPAPDGEADKLRAELQEAQRYASGLRVQIGALRLQNKRLQDEVRAGAAMLAAAQRQCEAGCPHAAEAAEHKRHAQALEQRLAQMQADCESHDRKYRDAAVFVPAQRGRRHG